MEWVVSSSIRVGRMEEEEEGGGKGQEGEGGDGGNELEVMHGGFMHGVCERVCGCIAKSRRDG
ncbi:hypothetical protein E2C01_084514 [Portunus trituberculatus]|uniref:Uncharacterized protein n=1 Tax=Portunus trituberculatus TaxID=210409 RepID=A0A5B7IYG8_PORTR|nr:hypothetical protein [Portunus trituberculatus]